MWLKKDAGGTTIKWEGREYEWPGDDDVTEVPAALGEVLLSIRGAGYSEAQAPEPDHDDGGEQQGGDGGQGDAPPAPPKPAQRRKAATAKSEGESS